jgi:hypothetical protein
MPSMPQFNVEEDSQRQGEQWYHQGSKIRGDLLYPPQQSLLLFLFSTIDKSLSMKAWDSGRRLWKFSGTQDLRKSF